MTGRARGPRPAHAPPRGLGARAAAAVRDWAHVTCALPRAALDTTPPDALAHGRRTPVVLLPGIWEPWRFLLPLARRLHAHGHPVHPLPGLGWNGRPLDESLARAHRDLERLASGGLRHAVLVAHSKGGLIGALLLAAREDAGDGRPALPRLDGLVAIGTPFAGSSLAVPAVRRTPLGMFEPDGQDVRRIAELTGVTDRLVSLGSAWDEMIPQGTRVTGATNLTLPATGHFLPVDAAATARVVHEHVERLGRSG